MSDKKNFAWPVTTLCKYDYMALKKFISENKEDLRKKEIIIFGSGIRGTSFSLLLNRFGYNNIKFTDNNAKKIGAYINKYRIIPVDEVIKNKNNEIVIISVENGFTIKDQLKAKGFLENRDFFYIENHLYDLYEKEFFRKADIDTLVMGDCGLTDLSLKDDDFANIGEQLKIMLGESKTKVLAIHAMGMRAFYQIFKAQIINVIKPKHVVLMTNLEIFTGKQHLLPRSQHAALIARLCNSLKQRDEELNEYARVAQERFENYKMDYFASSQEAMNDMSQDQNNKIVLKLNYMYKMDMNNECVVYLKKFIELCEAEGIKLLLFIPPANYQYAREIWGEKFTEKYEKNTEVLKDISDSYGVKLLDLSYLLASDKFADFHTIDETVNQYGRKEVVQAICEQLEETK